MHSTPVTCVKNCDNVTHPSNATDPRVLTEALYYLDVIQATLTSIGCIANVMTFVVLQHSKRDFAPTSLLLLQSQSLIDAIVCLLSPLLLLIPPMWSRGHFSFDQFICHFWHSQFFYFTCVSASVYNLMLISVDRLLAVCYPFKQQQFTTYRAKFALLVGYILGVSDACTTAFQVKMVDGGCVEGMLFDSPSAHLALTITIIYVWFAVFIIPCIFLVISNVKVVSKLRERVERSGIVTSQTIDQAARDLTVTTVVITVVFIPCIGYDITYFSLGHLGVVDYIINTPEQKMGILLSALNSVVNPFVYVMCMPIFRKNAYRTFCCCFNRIRRPKLLRRSAFDGAMSDVSNESTKPTSLSFTNLSLSSETRTIETVSGQVQ